jgi:hypothetical protein
VKLLANPVDFVALLYIEPVLILGLSSQQIKKSERKLPLKPPGITPTPGPCSAIVRAKAREPSRPF